MSVNVHNHGPSEGRGLDCGEPRLADGSPIGWCQILPLIRKAEVRAWLQGYDAGCEDMENGGNATSNPYESEEL